MKQNPTEQADTTESRLDQQSDDPNTQIPPIITKKQKKSKIENYVFYTIQM
jgi:hypothetical protein